MTIRFMKDDAVFALKNGINSNIEYYRDGGNDWLLSVTGMKDCFIDFKTTFDDFDLIISENPEKDDIENIKILYSKLMNLSDSQASDERLWVGLAHDTFWNYMKHRWTLKNAVGKEERYIKKNYFFAHGDTRSLMTNALARLWWIGRLTYDESYRNPFELTEYLAQDINGRGFPLFGSNFSNNKRILRIFLNTIKEYEQNNNFKLNRENFLEMIKSMNMWSGKIAIDCLEEIVLKEKLTEKLNMLKFIQNKS